MDCRLSPTSKVTPAYVQHERRQWMKALRAPQQNTHGRAVHYGRQGNRLSKWSKALMLKLPVEDSKTSVSDTASALQALVSFQYQNKTCRIIGVLKFTTCKPRRSTSLHQGDRVQQMLGNKKTRGTRIIVKITYNHGVSHKSCSQTHCQRGLPDRASDWWSRCVNESSGRSFQSRLWRGASQDLRGCWQVAQTCATPPRLKTSSWSSKF